MALQHPWPVSLLLSLASFSASPYSSPQHLPVSPMTSPGHFICHPVSYESYQLTNSITWISFNGLDCYCLHQTNSKIFPFGWREFLLYEEINCSAFFKGWGFVCEAGRERGKKRERGREWERMTRESKCVLMKVPHNMIAFLYSL